jgi:hypothetical protein
MGVKLSQIGNPIVRAQILRQLHGGAPGLRTAVAAEQPATPRRIRQEQGPLLNVLETEWLCVLVARTPDGTPIRAQAKRFRLANGIWYKPDFTATVAGREMAWEVKGPHAFRGGFENLKVAATAYPEVLWTLVWKDETGRWCEQTVMP